MQLLFITQKIDQSDDDLAFTILWVKEFIKQGFDVSVICLQKGSFDDSFPVYSLGKEEGRGKLVQIWRFLKLIFTLKYKRVFVHMNPEYFTLGGWWWFLRGTPSYLWYTHYTMTLHLWLAGIFTKRLFAATSQSLPQFEGSSKKVIPGHGIDIEFWKDSIPVVAANPHNLLSVHRISRSKRLELVIKALALLPKDFTLAVYGRPIDSEYFKELKMLIEKEGLIKRVQFMGPVPMYELRSVYSKYRLMVNMASETIDKTMLEGMVYGIFPVTTKGNSEAIGLDMYPESDSPKDLAEFILSENWMEYDKERLLDLVQKKHSLPALVGKMGDFIKDGK